MSSQNVIEVKNLSKTFKLPHQKVDSLREGISSVFQKKTYEKFRALDNVSFEVKQGEFFGIIGRNGSGKSTLLKILARIYQPDKGSVEITGKISPFLELGVGFNPELTAKENVFLNGIVLGLSHKELEKRYPEIVKFSGLKKFMDTKLKNFSSGMQVRLAFSVAIQADADIYLIDEVLAVGDAEFQEKCFSIFREMKKNGKTIVFVSHDLSSVSELCTTVLLLEEGKVSFVGKSEDTLMYYLKLNLTRQKREKQKSRTGINNDFKVKKVSFLNSAKKETELYRTGDTLIVRINFICRKKINKPVFGVEIRRDDGVYISGPNTKYSLYQIKSIDSTNKYIDCKIESIPFLGGNYYVTIHVVDDSMLNYYDLADKAASFKVASTELNQAGIMKIDGEWTVK